MKTYYKLLQVSYFFTCCFLFAQNQSDIIIEIKKVSQKDPVSAIVFAKKHLSQSFDEVTKANIYIEISQSYSKLGNKNLAIYYAKKAKEEALKTSDTELIPRVYGSLANQYRKATLLRNARTEITEGLNYVNGHSNNISYNWIKAAFLREYSRILIDEKKIDSSIIYSHKALRSISKLNRDKKIEAREIIYQNLISLDLSEAFLHKKEIDSSEYYSLKVLNKARGILTEDNYKKNALLNLSLVYFKKGQYQRTLDTLKNLEKTIREDEYPLRADLYSRISYVYKSLDDFKNQEKYLTLYYNIKDKLDKDKLNAIDQLVLNLEKEKQEEKEKSESNRRLIFGLIIISALVLVFVILFFQRKRRTEKIYYQKYIDKIESKIRFEEQDAEKSEIIKSLKISDEIVQNILLQLQKFEASEKFTDSNLNIGSLSSNFKTNTKYLSEIIKVHKGMNFNSYINTLRIEFICKKIVSDPLYRKYKISHLATLSGFSSVNNFSKIFKEITKMSPSSFIENSSDFERE